MTWMSRVWANGMMNTNLLISPSLVQSYSDALERWWEEHFVQIGDFNCLFIDSLPKDVMYICQGEKVLKVVNIGTKEN